MSKHYLHLFQTKESESNYKFSQQYEEPYLSAVEPTREAFYNKPSDIIIDDDTTYQLKYWWSGKDAPINNNWYDRINNIAWNTTYCTYDAENQWYDMTANKSYCYMENNKHIKLGAQFKINIRTMFKHKPGATYGNYIGDLGGLRTGNININLGSFTGTSVGSNNQGIGISVNCKSASNSSIGPTYNNSTLQNNFSTWTDYQYLEYEIGYKKISETQAQCYSLYNNQYAYGPVHTSLNWNNIGTGGYFALGMGWLSTVGENPSAPSSGTGPSVKSLIKMMDIKMYVSET